MCAVERSVTMWTRSNHHHSLWLVNWRRYFALIGWNLHDCVIVVFWVGHPTPRQFTFSWFSLCYKIWKMFLKIFCCFKPHLLHPMFSFIREASIFHFSAITFNTSNTFPILRSEYISLLGINIYIYEVLNMSIILSFYMTNFFFR